MQRTAFYAFLMLLAATCFGLTSPIMKLAYDAGFSVQDVTNAQYGLGLVILWGIWLTVVIVRRAKRPSLPRKQWILLIAIGIANALTSFGYYQALTVLPASLGIVLLFQFTWMVMAMDAIFVRRWPTWEKWAGILIILAGTLLAVGARTLAAQNNPGVHHVPVWAILMGLLGGFGYALVLFLSGFIAEDGSPIYRSSVSIIASTLIIAIPFHPTYLWSGVLWHGLWFWGLLVALSSQVFPLLLMLVAVPRIGGRMAGVLGSIELPVAVVAAHLMVGEAVTPARWLGVALILAGILISELIGSRNKQPQLPDWSDATP